MKPDNTVKGHVPAQHCPDTARNRVGVEFLPDSGWQIEIGRTPAKLFPDPQSMRDNEGTTQYKRPYGNSRRRQTFVPVELVIDAEDKRSGSRQLGCPVKPAN